eukprot:scaffold7609_cov112-Isochrysis_galbana.AAC.7
MAAGAFARLGLRLFCLLLLPGVKECPQAPQDEAGRETPERKGVGWLTARAGRPGRWWCKVGGKPISLGVEGRVNCSLLMRLVWASLRRDRLVGVVWCPVGGKNIILRVEERTRRGVRGAKACARLSFRGRRVNRSGSGLMDFSASSAARNENGSQNGSTICGRVQMVVDPGGCCSGQLFAVVVMGGAATPKGVFAALTTHAMSRSSGQ